MVLVTLGQSLGSLIPCEPGVLLGSCYRWSSRQGPPALLQGKSRGRRGSPPRAPPSQSFQHCQGRQAEPRTLAALPDQGAQRIPCPEG